MDGRQRAWGRAAAAAALAGLALAATGCMHVAGAKLYSDTAAPDGQFSDAKRQWAYDGETVTFELVCDAGAVHYVVFGAGGDEEVVDSGKDEGRFRWSSTFHAGIGDKQYLVYGKPYLVRGRRDYIYDRLDQKWHFYPGRTDPVDVGTDREQVIRLVCYRREFRVPVAGRGGPPKRIEVGLVKATGERTAVPPRPAGEPEARGFVVLGPDAKGLYTVSYTPTHTEVSRSGVTRAELLVEHADGSQERVQQDVDTP